MGGCVRGFGITGVLARSPRSDRRPRVRSRRGSKRGLGRRGRVDAIQNFERCRSDLEGTQQGLSHDFAGAVACKKDVGDSTCGKGVVVAPSHTETG